MRIDGRDRMYIALGAAAGIGGGLAAGGVTVAVGFLLGCIATGLVCLQVLRLQRLALDAAERAAGDLGAELLREIDETARLREVLRGVLTSPVPADLSRTARCQEEPCSSNPTSAG